MEQFTDLEKNILYVEILLLISASVFILLQNRGSGLSSSFGGSNEVYLTRRGIEKSVVTLSVVAIVTFVLIRFISFYL